MQKDMQKDKTPELLQQLRSTLSKMELSLGAIDDAIIWIDKKYIIQWCNARFSHLVGQPHILILGKLVNDILFLKQSGKTISLENILTDHLNNKNKFPFNIYEFKKNNEIQFFEISSK